jgi:hypothetical protein
VLDDAKAQKPTYKLQKKLIDARSRQNALMTRLESAKTGNCAPCIMVTRFRRLQPLMTSNAGREDSSIGADGPKTLGEEIDAFNAPTKSMRTRSHEKAMKKG